MDEFISIGGVDYAFVTVTIDGVEVRVARNLLGFRIGDQHFEVSDANRLPVEASVSADQDPVFDHANATRTAVTGPSKVAIAPPAGCKYVLLLAKGECFVRTDGAEAAVDTAGSMRLLADVERQIPVTPGVNVTVIAAADTVLEATPFKAR